MSLTTRRGLIPQETIDQAARLLLEAAPAGSEVILFGSYARGNAAAHSDVDFLVVEPFVNGQRREMVRLREVLRPLRIPVEVLVVSFEGFEAWKSQVNTIVYEADREGRRYRHAG
jgi:predicted nucleotidyltransferase